MNGRQIIQRPPNSPAAFRHAAYTGDLFLCPPTPASLRLVAQSQSLMERELGPQPRTALARVGPDAHFEAIGRIRRTLYMDTAFHDAAFAVLSEVGLGSPGPTAIDPLRLRVVASDGHRNQDARAVYYPHRDTWYGHPQTLLTVWIALDDLNADETFVFYPEAFSEPLANDSEIFDYREWVRDGWQLKIGWQSKDSGRTARYPQFLGKLDGREPLGFSCRAGEVLVFSGSHFHRTLPQTTGRTRFSLDFRCVNLADEQRGLGAPAVDNRSQGSALVDYVRRSLA